jgi:hypothetical protein
LQDAQDQSQKDAEENEEKQSTPGMKVKAKRAVQGGGPAKKKTRR